MSVKVKLKEEILSIIAEARDSLLDLEELLDCHDEENTIAPFVDELISNEENILKETIDNFRRTINKVTADCSEVISQLDVVNSYYLADGFWDEVEIRNNLKIADIRQKCYHLIEAIDQETADRISKSKETNPFSDFQFELMFSLFDREFVQQGLPVVLIRMGEPAVTAYLKGEIIELDNSIVTNYYKEEKGTH